MSRRDRGISGSRFSTAIVLLVAAFALAPAVAQAVSPRRVWFQKGKEIKKGAKHVAVSTKGTLVVRMLSGPQAGLEISCQKVTGRGEIWNPAPVGFGEDRIDSITFSKCAAGAKTCTVHPLALPWQSILFRNEADEDGDTLEGVTVEAICAGVGSVLEGELAGPVPPNHLELHGLLADGVHEVEAEASLVLHLKAHGGQITINA